MLTVNNVNRCTRNIPNVMLTFHTSKFPYPQIAFDVRSTDKIISTDFSITTHDQHQINRSVQNENWETKMSTRSEESAQLFVMLALN